MRMLKGRHLFIDDDLVSDSDNIVFTVNPPCKEGRTIRPDRPWDAASACVNSTVLDGDECRLYYVGTDKAARHFLCMALSSDGRRWRKPELGAFRYGRSKKNNIVLEDTRISGTVFVDPAGKRSQRYKFLSADGKRGARLFVSPNGLDFKLLRTDLMPFYLDNHICGFRDNRIGKYVVYMRGWSPPNEGYRWMGFREIARAELDDVTTPWPYNRRARLRMMGKNALPVVHGQFPCVMRRDEQDPPTMDIYNLSAVKYPFAEDVYLGFPSVYYRYPFPPAGKYINNGMLEIQLAVSRDGVKWRRYRTPYVGGGIHGEPDWARLHMGVGMVFRGDIIYQYYRGLNILHGQGRTGLREYEPPPPESRPSRTLGLGTLSQRVDGFVSADAAYRGGTLTTKPFVFGGSGLSVNMNTTAMGTARVVLLNRNKRPVKGFAAGDCDVIQGNFAKKQVTWRGSGDVSSLRGKPVRLRFDMRAAKLYAFEFSPTPGTG
ncbi:hypothetical protein ACFLSJ_01230 [Verrucomicrobiota bacterium]